MKKIILTLALVAFGMTASAQWVLGGNIGFDHDGNSTGDYSDNATTELSIMPKIGYWLNEDMQIGIQLGCNYDYARNYDGDNNNDHYSSRTQLEWRFAPYFRYNLTSWKNFTVFCEAQLAFGITPKRSTWNNTTSTSGEGNTSSFDINFNVVPGLNYALTDKISFDAYIDLLGLYYNYNATTRTIGATDVTSHEHNYGFIADMNAMPIIGNGAIDPTTMLITNGGHFSLIRIGFNYAF